MMRSSSQVGLKRKEPKKHLRHVVFESLFKNVLKIYGIMQKVRQKRKLKGGHSKDKKSHHQWPPIRRHHRAQTQLSPEEQYVDTSHLCH